MIIHSLKISPNKHYILHAYIGRCKTTWIRHCSSQSPKIFIWAAPSSTSLVIDQQMLLQSLSKQASAA